MKEQNGRWVILTDNYQDKIIKNAIVLLNKEISQYLNYVLPVIKFKEELNDLKNDNLIVIGNQNTNSFIKSCIKKGLIGVSYEEGFSIAVSTSPYNEERQAIVISATTPKGILNGCAEFINTYMGSVVYKRGDVYYKDFFLEPFNVKMPEWKFTSNPKTKTRGIWTWGHVIYDYRRFLENMAKLKLNEIVIWNDVVPLNAKDVVDYAHSLGIKVIWGFAWGWETDCSIMLKNWNDKVKEKIISQIVEKYQAEYLDTNADGIYFQSFTELNCESVNGQDIALTVTDLVNQTAKRIFALSPNIHLQFGLHSDSVKNKLNVIKAVDKRIHIVWENCGCFPFSYDNDEIETHKQTLEFVDKILRLRGEDEKFGAVIKGATKLDWSTFEHFDKTYFLGERNQKFINARTEYKDHLWKLFQAGWMKNGEIVRNIIQNVVDKNPNAIIEALVEDGAFESRIPFPVALYAEILWNPNQEIENIKRKVMESPFVEFSNI